MSLTIPSSCIMSILRRHFGARGGQQGIRARVRAAGKAMEGMTDTRTIHPLYYDTDETKHVISEDVSGTADELAADRNTKYPRTVPLGRRELSFFRSHKYSWRSLSSASVYTITGNLSGHCCVFVQCALSLRGNHGVSPLIMMDIIHERATGTCSSHPA